MLTNRQPSVFQQELKSGDSILITINLTDIGILPPEFPELRGKRRKVLINREVKSVRLDYEPNGLLCNS